MGSIVNGSGISPVHTHIVVKLDSEEKMTRGGIIIPEKVREREKYAQEVGTLIAVGPATFWDFDKVDRERLVPGTRIMINKYSGTTVMGPLDRERYQLMNDKDITAIIEEVDDE